MPSLTSTEERKSALVGARQVLGGSSKALGIVGESGQGRVADPAQQSSNGAGVMVVVDVKDLVLGASPSRRAETDGTDSSLGFQEGVVVLDGDAVGLQQVSSPHVVPVGFVPGLVLCLDDFTVGVAVRRGSLSSSNTTTPTVGSFDDRDFGGAQTTERHAIGRVDALKAMSCDAVIGAAPSIPVTLDRHFATSRARCRARRLVHVRQNVIDGARCVTSKEQHRLPLLPPFARRCLRRERGLFAASTVTKSAFNGAAR